MEARVWTFDLVVGSRCGDMPGHTARYDASRCRSEGAFGWEDYINDLFSTFYF